MEWVLLSFSPQYTGFTRATILVCGPFVYLHPSLTIQTKKPALSSSAPDEMTVGLTWKKFWRSKKELSKARHQTVNTFLSWFRLEMPTKAFFTLLLHCGKQDQAASSNAKFLYMFGNWPTTTTTGGQSSSGSASGHWDRTVAETQRGLGTQNGALD